MILKILDVVTVDAYEVRKGDLLIHPRLPNGFGHVEYVGWKAPPAEIVAVAVEGKRAFEFDPWEPVEIAAEIVDSHGYGRREVYGVPLAEVDTPRVDKPGAGRVEGCS